MQGSGTALVNKTKQEADRPMAFWIGLDPVSEGTLDPEGQLERERRCRGRNGHERLVGTSADSYV